MAGDAIDPRERFPDLEEIIHTAIQAHLARLQTAMPVRVVKDSDGHTVSLQPLIQSVVRQQDGTTKLTNLPMLDDVPVQYASGGGTTFTHPIKGGDEGIVIFSSRSLDAWHQQGGVQKQVDARMHDLSDGMFIPGIRSTPRKLENVSTTSAQMRSDDGKHMVDLHPTDGIKASVDNGKHVMTMNPTTGISHTSTMKIAMNAPAFSIGGQGGSGSGGAAALTLEGTLNITGDVIANGVSLTTHTHGGVVAGGQHTAQPDQD